MMQSEAEIGLGQPSLNAAGLHVASRMHTAGRTAAPQPRCCVKAMQGKRIGMGGQDAVSDGHASRWDLLLADMHSLAAGLQPL